MSSACAGHARATTAAHVMQNAAAIPRNALALSCELEISLDANKAARFASIFESWERLAEIEAKLRGRFSGLGTEIAEPRRASPRCGLFAEEPDPAHGWRAIRRSESS